VRGARGEDGLRCWRRAGCTYRLSRGVVSMALMGMPCCGGILTSLSPHCVCLFVPSHHLTELPPCHSFASLIRVTFLSHGAKQTKQTSAPGKTCLNPQPCLTFPSGLFHFSTLSHDIQGVGGFPESNLQPKTQPHKILDNYNPFR
jgi:hypothetical protein